MAAAPHARRGFTMIELLVVVGIMAVLSSMVVPVVAMARRAAITTNTRALLMRVEGALEMFRAETDTLPYQAYDPADPFPGSNDLAYHLAHDLDAAEAAALRADLDAVESAYSPGGVHAFGVADLLPRQLPDQPLPDLDQAYVAGLNRIAIQRASLAVFSGDTAITGQGPRSGIRVIPRPASRGFAADYLGEDLAPKEIFGDAILDPLGQPLCYVSPVLPEVSGLMLSETEILPFSSAYWKPIDPERYGLAGRGRQVVTDLDSDLRFTAAEQYADDFELWAAGFDGRIEARRSDPANRDNLGARAYWEALQ